MRYILILQLVFILRGCSKNNISYNLNSNWVFSKENDSIEMIAEVPGIVHLDLLRNNEIEDPYYRNNEQKLQWIENENWIYKTSFYLDKKQFQNQHIEITFLGLDTYTNVYLNEKKIIEASNMFRAWTVDIKNHANIGLNKLRVEFISPIKFNSEIVAKSKFKLPAGNETVSVKVSPYTRKAAYHFGWDWGPRFVTMGIWKDIIISTWNDFKIEETIISTQEISDNNAIVSFTTFYKGKFSSNNKILYKMLDADKKEVKFKLLSQQVIEEENKIETFIEVDSPNLWWPNGEGIPYLYSLKTYNNIDSTIQNFGIRKIELIQELDSIGKSYFFKINNKPIFIKGANYIPQDIFLTRVSSYQYENLLEKVVEANMNMLRVWGGGIYENDIFYDLCDQKGILIWQDFMFAGSLYPSEHSFIDNVTEEVQYNIKRLSSHPSIALWCGNNEIEVAWNNWGWQQQFGYSDKDSIELWNSYKQLFNNVIPNTLKSIKANANYVSTTPLSNWGTSENFKNSSMHYWGVWHGKEPFENFKSNVGRFMVEYGFQSFPDKSTIEKFSEEMDFSITSEVMKNRQKSYIGTPLISSHIERWYNTPTSFFDFVEKSQNVQKIALQTAIQSHRLKEPYCMGTLFWQLNDCWPGPSWSVIDYYGTKKKAFETVKNNFSDIIAIPDFNNNELIILSKSKDIRTVVVNIYLNERDNLFSKSIEIHPNHKISFNNFLPKRVMELSKVDITIEIEENSELIYKDSFRKL